MYIFVYNMYEQQGENIDSDCFGTKRWILALLGIMYVESTVM